MYSWLPKRGPQATRLRQRKFACGSVGEVSGIIKSNQNSPGKFKYRELIQHHASNYSFFKWQ